MVNEELIVKYLAGEAEDHELAILNQWRQESSENEMRFHQLEKIWNDSAALSDKREFDTDRAWQKVQARTSVAGGKIKSITTRNTWMAAASLAILCILSIVFFTINRNEERMLSSNAGKAQIELKLNDGSTVILKEGSLEYPEEFEGDKRQVHLKKGKAFFKVAHNEAKPFKILAGSTTVTVLGTEFEVNTDEINTTVKVKSGKVRFASASGERILTAGKSARFNSGNSSFETLDIQSDNSMSYATGNLEFKNLPLANVVADLNAYYSDRTIQIDPALADCRLTATFENEKLENVLEVIRVTMNVQVRWDKASSSYKIEGRTCQP